MDWNDRVAVIAGASGGIGAATARRLGRAGMRLALVARSADRLETLASELRAAGTEALVVPADLANEHDCWRAVERVAGTLGDVDVLVNSAGLGWYGYGSDMPWPLAAEMLQVNVNAVVNLTHMLLPGMLARGRGYIVNVSSITGSMPIQGTALYSASKAFVDSFTSALYRELRGTGVHLSVVKPGPVATEFFARAALRNGRLPSKTERFAVRADVVADRIWSLLQRPRKSSFVPRTLRLVPWLELGFGWLVDLLGPVLLRRRGVPAAAQAGR
jgi:short-subunit dehydrogenase